MDGGTLSQALNYAIWYNNEQTKLKKQSIFERE